MRKYDICPKFITTITTIVMTILLIFVGIGSYDMIKNPMRVADNKLLKELDAYNLGTTREVEYLGLMTDDFGIYEVITTKGFYNVYISLNKNNIEIEGIKEILKNKTLKWNTSLPTEYKDIPASILSLFINQRSYGENIKNIEKIDEDQYKITYTDNNYYIFNISYYKVYQIYDQNNELKYTCKTLIEFKDDFQKIIDENIDLFKNVEKIDAYIVTTDKIEYTFENFCGNYYKIIKYNDGSFDIQQSDDNISNSKMEEQWQTYKKNKNN